MTDWLLRSLSVATLYAFPLSSSQDIYSITEKNKPLPFPKGGIEGRECKYSWELTDLNGEAEAGIPLRINIFLFPQPHY